MTTPDPTGRLGDLDAALTDPRLAHLTADGGGPAGAAQAALRLAVALGYCRLYGLGGDGRLPPEAAVAAAGRLARRLAELADRADRLGADWDAEPDPLLADDRVADLLRGRTDALAAAVALHEAADAPAVAAAVARLADPLDRFDAVLERHADLLATQFDSPLVDEWRHRLAGPYRDPLPWWVGDELIRLAGRRADVAVVIPPAGPPELVLAADAAGRPGGAFTAWRWNDPAGRYRFELYLPRHRQPADDARSFTGNLFRADGELAVELAGVPVRLGPVEQVADARGRVTVRLSDITGVPLRVLVGTPAVEWLYHREGAK